MHFPSLWRLQILMVTVCTVLGGCAILTKPTAEELQTLDSPPAVINAKIERLLPDVVAWYQALEVELLPQGRVLSARELEVARRLGVSNPEKVRVAVLEVFPLPSDPELLVEAKRYGFGSRFEAGRTDGYVITLKPWVAENQTVLAHELVHVSQYERMGRKAFLRRYLLEMEILGYARSPLELEAYSKQNLVQ